MGPRAPGATFRLGPASLRCGGAASGSRDGGVGRYARLAVRGGVPAERVHVVPNALPVDSLRFSAAGRRRLRAELGIPLDAPVIGCVSRFHRKKRNDVAIDAVVRLARDNIHLVMAGEGETEEELRRRAAPLDDRVHFVPTPGSELVNVCSTCDVTVFCPSPT